MKKNIIIAGIMAAMLVPAVAQAQPQPHDRERYQENRGNPVIQKREQELKKQREAELKKQQEFRQAQQRDHRDARNHQNDWRRDARYNNFRAPFAYQRFQVGAKLKPNYYAANYRKNWDSRWGLPRAKKNEAYVRHYNDLLLVNERNGKVIRVYRDHFRYR